MKYIICGASLISGNKGVNALTRATINGLLENQNVTDINIISYSTKKEIEHVFKYKNKNIIIKEIPLDRYLKVFLMKVKMYGLGLKPVMMFTKSFKYIKEADYILDISEGDSFSDIYGKKRFELHSIIKSIAIDLGKNLIIMPQTIGPFKDLEVNNKAKKLLLKSNKIYTRDRISYDLVVKEFNINKEKVTLTPDLAFYMKPNDNVEINKYISKFKSDKNIIGINISGLLYNGGYDKNNMFNLKCNYSELIIKIIEWLIENTNSNILLIPHVIPLDLPVENDLMSIKKIMEKLDEKVIDRVSFVSDDLSEDKLKYIISKCEFFIGSRMHACIAAVSTNVPTMPIAYSRKFVGIWNELELGWCVADPREEDENEIMNKLFKIYKEKQKINQVLKIKNCEFNNTLKEIFKMIK